MKLFKVVSQLANGALGSAIVHPTGFNVIYVPNEFVRPRMGKLFAFDEWTEATQFIRMNDVINPQIWEAEGEGINSPKQRVNFWGHVDKTMDDLIEAYWNQKTNPKLMTVACAYGTVWCDAIKLLTKAPII